MPVVVPPAPSVPLLLVTPPRLPSFAPISVIGRKARPVLLNGHGNSLKSFNIITREEISDRIYSLCERVLNPSLSGSDVTFVPIMNGAINFYAAISSLFIEGSHVELMPIHARSYDKEQTPGPVFVSPDLIIPEKIEGKTLVIIDDVLETGSTACEVIRLLKQYNPTRIVTIFLLRKQQQEPIGFTPDYWLFDVHPESWVFGFGMDLAEKYRHLRFICDARTGLYRSDGTPNY